MSRWIRQPIRVIERSGLPVAIEWGDRIIPVREHLDGWIETGRWWDGESERRFLRVATARGIYEIGCDAATLQWHLYRIFD